MSTQILKDRSGNMIGKIVKVGSRYFIYDVRGNSLGHYDPSINVTFIQVVTELGKGIY